MILVHNGEERTEVELLWDEIEVPRAELYNANFAKREAEKELDELRQGIKRVIRLQEEEIG